jgi:tRNA threonylcarbamoyladenosine biosynthesis protein TsaE
VKIRDLGAMDRLARRLARVSGVNPRVVYLQGPLGTGKTTLVRCWLRHLGFDGRIRSPTFTILECYERDGLTVVVHADLFRIRGAEELLNTGLRDYWGNALLLIEWPERGEAETPPADWSIRIGFGGRDGERCLHLLHHVNY